MSQHDYVIANGTGAAVRSDLNNALAAIVSQNSGATEPATMYAYQWWADTTTGLLKLRNAANSAWITLRELDGTLTIEDGTAGSPGLAFADDLNTGIYSPGADQVAFTAGGTARLTATTTGITSALPVDVPLGSASAPTVTFTGDLNTGIYSPGADQVAISTGGTERARIDSSGRLLVGTTTANTSGAKLQTVDGITFPATQVASADPNTLDDYEEGTFTPTVIGTSTAGTATYAIQNARYTKTGRAVFIEMLLNWSAGTGTGNLRVSGLPFTSGSAVTTPSLALSFCSDIAMTASHVLTARIADNSTQIDFLSYPSGGGAYAVVAYDAAGVVGISGCYSV